MFELYFSKFLGHSDISHTVINDGFEVYFACEEIKFCNMHCIAPFCLPAQSSDKTYHLDRLVFEILLSTYKMHRSLANRIHAIWRKYIPEVMHQARLEACKKQNSAAGFRVISLYPVNRWKLLVIIFPNSSGSNDWNSSALLVPQCVRLIAQ